MNDIALKETRGKRRRHIRSTFHGAYQNVVPLSLSTGWSLSRIARWVLLGASGLLLLFGRGGMFAVFGEYTLLDRVLNILLLTITPLFFCFLLLKRLPGYLRVMWPLLLLMVWVSTTLIYNPGTSYFPDRTSLITLAYSIFICSQVNHKDLKFLRYVILFFGAFFSLMVLINQSYLNELLNSGILRYRLGLDTSVANIIIYPRAMYAIVYTSLVTFLMKERIWFRLGALVFAVLPLMVALATANRGTAVAFALASCLFVILQIRSRRIIGFLSAALFVIMTWFIYPIILDLFPVFARRVMLEGDSGRWEIWKPVLEQVSLFGFGVPSEYVHNIFLEFLHDHGLIGLFLFLFLLFHVLGRVWRLFSHTGDLNVLWALGLWAFQMTAQQFSLNIYMAGSLWASFALMIGITIGEKCVSQPQLAVAQTTRSREVLS